jgi:lipopolysaccharide biosynthesis regulator YciM
VQGALEQLLTVLQDNPEVIQQFPGAAQHCYKQTAVEAARQLLLVLVEQAQQLLAILAAEMVEMVVKKLQLKTVAVAVLVDILEMVV